MADSPISSLPAVENLPNGQPNIETNDLFVLEHINDGQKRACKVSGDQVTKFVNRNVVAYDGSIVASDAAGGANYDPNTEKLTLVLPHGAGIAEVIQKPSTVENDRVVDWYALKTEDAQYTSTKELGKELTPWIKVTNGKDGQGTVNSVMGIGPGGSQPNPFNPSLDVPKSVLMDYIHPVGSVYISSRYFSPATQFSGTWVRLMNRFLYASGPGAVTGAGNAVGTLDGSATKTISRANLPPQNLRLGQCAHTTAANPDVDLSASNFENVNTFGVYSMSPGTATAWVVPSLNKATAGGYSRPDKDIITEKLGSGTAMDIMPPYRTYHAWERVGETHVYGTDSDHGYFTDGAYIATNKETINMLTYSISASASTCVIACCPGDTFTLTGTGASSARLWAFVGADGTTRKRVSGSGAVETGLILTAGADEAFLIVNVQNGETFSLVGGTASE